MAQKLEKGDFGCKEEVDYKQKLDSMPSDVPFRMMLRANGQSEVWSDPLTEISRVKEYGWRCGVNEDSYKLDTLMGNWCEEWRDMEWLKVPKSSLPSQFDHYFQPTYAVTYNKAPLFSVPPQLKLIQGRHPRAYSSHQPELDSDSLKAVYNSWRTTYKGEYLDPRFRNRPVVLPKPNPSQPGTSRSSTSAADEARSCPMTKRGD